MKSSEELYRLKLDLYYYEEYLKRAKNTNEECQSFNKDIRYCSKEIDKTYAKLMDDVDVIGQCSHPLWYLVDIDKEFGVKSYHCKCLKCGKEKIGSRELFNHLVAFNSLKGGSFEDMKAIFNETYKEEEKIPTRRLMLEKYRVI